MGTLDNLAAKISSNVWLSGKYWAEDADFFPKGVSGSKQEFRTATGKAVVVNRQAYEGTNEANGDGRTTVQARGDAERQTIEVEMPVEANVSLPQDELRPDKIKLLEDGSIWFASRTLSSDSATKKVLFVSKHTKSTRIKRRSQ